MIILPEEKAYYCIMLHSSRFRATAPVCGAGWGGWVVFSEAEWEVSGEFRGNAGKELGIEGKFLGAQKRKIRLGKRLGFRVLRGGRRRERATE